MSVIQDKGLREAKYGELDEKSKDIKDRVMTYCIDMPFQNSESYHVATGNACATSFSRTKLRGRQWPMIDIIQTFQSGWGQYSLILFFRMSTASPVGGSEQLSSTMFRSMTNSKLSISVSSYNFYYSYGGVAVY